MTILEALRVLLTDPTIAAGEAAQTLEFHWYAGEEAGLLGSNDLFETYAADGEIVKGMLQQDMTGYGNNPLGVVTDNVDEGLTEFIKKVIDEVSQPPPPPPSPSPLPCSRSARSSSSGRSQMGIRGFFPFLPVSLDLPGVFFRPCPLSLIFPSAVNFAPSYMGLRPGMSGTQVVLLRLSTFVSSLHAVFGGTVGVSGFELGLRKEKS